MKYRKRPVVIEAVQLRWDTWSEVCEFADVGGLKYGKPEGTDRSPLDSRPLPDGGPGLLIPTLEGVMFAAPGDWIIRGVQGELYPCKPTIFEATYEPVVGGGGVMTRQELEWRITLTVVVIFIVVSFFVMDAVLHGSELALNESGLTSAPGGVE